MDEFRSLFKETLIAGVAVLALSSFICVVFWAVTGFSPWPGLVLGSISGFGFGIALLALTAPRRR